jgi:hypothetical protein
LEETEAAFGVESEEAMHMRGKYEAVRSELKQQISPSERRKQVEAALSKVEKDMDKKHAEYEREEGVIQGIQEKAQRVREELEAQLDQAKARLAAIYEKGKQLEKDRKGLQAELAVLCTETVQAMVPAVPTMEQLKALDLGSQHRALALLEELRAMCGAAGTAKAEEAPRGQEHAGSLCGAAGAAGSDEEMSSDGDAEAGSALGSEGWETIGKGRRIKRPSSKPKNDRMVRSKFTKGESEAGSAGHTPRVVPPPSALGTTTPALPAVAEATATGPPDQGGKEEGQGGPRTPVVGECG